MEHVGIRTLRIDYAQAMDAGLIIQILALRRAIEAEKAAEAALRRKDKQIMLIDERLAAIDIAVERGKEGVAEDIAFRGKLAEITDNSYFLKTLTFMNQYLEAGIVIIRRNDSIREDSSHQVLEEHAAIAPGV